MTSSDRLSRTVTVDGCPDGCWLVLGEGFHEAWSAPTADGDLGPPTLVDGGFNGWRIPPSDGPTVDPELDGPAPLTIALVLGWRWWLHRPGRARPPARRPDGVRAAGPLRVPRPARSPVVARGRRGVWIVAAGLFVGPQWALAAAAGVPWSSAGPVGPGWPAW